MKSDDGTYDFIPEPDYSPPPSPTTPSSPVGNGSLQRDQQSSGVYKRRISSDEEVTTETRGSGLYQRVIKDDSQTNIQPQRPSGKYTKAIPSPGAVNVMSEFKLPKLKPVNRSFDKSFDSDPKSPVSPGSPRENELNSSYDNVKPSNIKQMNQKQEQVYVNDVRDKSPEKSDKPVSPRYKTRQAPPVPSAPRAAPPPPAPCSPGVPAPPPLTGHFDKAGKGKLKQVHWNKTPKPNVSRHKCLAIAI